MPVAVPLLDSAPPLVLFPVLEVPFAKGASPTIEVPLEEEVEFDPTRGPPVELPSVEVGAMVVVLGDPESSVVVTTEPPPTTAPPEPLSELAVTVVLGPVETTTVFVPVVATVVVVPEPPLARSIRVDVSVCAPLRWIEDLLWQYSLPKSMTELRSAFGGHASAVQSRIPKPKSSLVHRQATSVGPEQPSDEARLSMLVMHSLCSSHQSKIINRWKRS